MSQKKTNDQNTLYLSEDEDLLVGLDGSGLTSDPPTIRQTKFVEKQIRATLRTRKTMEELNRSTEKFSIALMLIAIIQVILALFQFLFSILDSNIMWPGLFLFALTGIFIWRVSKEFLD